jgi:tRNA wybutosine-synthesizing protein 2
MKQLKQILSAVVPEDKVELLPSGFQRIGDVVILNLKPELKQFEKDIGNILLKSFPNIKTVCAKFDSVKGELRVPQVRKIAGNGTETTHTENGCKYRLDVTKVMFAKGNVNERGRLPKLIQPNETIVDMFAGIGYFTIPIAVHSSPQKIVAIEKNPISVKFLRQNIRLNKASNVEVIEADNREVEGLESFADRVVMGYLPGTEKYLPTSFKFLKPAGGTIHYHNTYRKPHLWNRPFIELEDAARIAGYKLDRIIYKGIVKHFAPGIEHVVIDAIFRRA